MSTTRYDTDVDLSNTNSTYGLIGLHIREGADVLDIGCATGNLARALMMSKHCHVWGIDIDPEATAIALSRGVAAISGDVTRTRVVDLVGGKDFDVVILADVLEHLLEPEVLLRRLRSVLRPNGVILTSFPNIAHLDVQIMLAQDDWRYAPTGLLDQTHLRFFTLGSFRALASRAGYHAVSTDRVIVPVLATEILDFGRGVRLTENAVRLVAAANERSNPNVTVYQYVLELRPVDTEQDAPPDQSDIVEESGQQELRVVPQLCEIVVAAGGGDDVMLEATLRSVALQMYAEVHAVVVTDSASRSWVERVVESVDDLRASIVADDSSDDDAADWFVRAIEIGMERSAGDFVTFCTAGDQFLPEFALQLIGQLRAAPSAAVAYGLGAASDSGASKPEEGADDRQGTLGGPFDIGRLFFEDYIPLCGCMVRVSDLRSSGVRFDSSRPHFGGWLLLRDLAARFDFTFVDEVVYQPSSKSVGTLFEEGPGRATAESDLRREMGLQRVSVRAVDLQRRYLAERALKVWRRRSAQMLYSRSWRLTRPLRWILRSNLPEKVIDELDGTHPE
jgi:methionine biosynthesis protein MetW